MSIILLRASCLSLEINEFRGYEAKIEESKRLAVTRSWTEDTSGLSCQCSATDLRQPDNYQPSQSSICTAIISITHKTALGFATPPRHPPDGPVCQYTYVTSWAGLLVLQAMVATDSSDVQDCHQRLVVPLISFSLFSNPLNPNPPLNDALLASLDQFSG